MLNNVVLDVAIGLVFLYLLYSLLATTIKELLATMFTYRGKMLERGIEQMLDGVNYKYRWWNKLRRKLVPKNQEGLRPSKILEQKSGLFAHKIISHDLYKRLAEKSIVDKPSYLAADTFSDILVDILKDNKEGPILMKDISTYVEGISNPGLQKILKLYIEQANGDLQKFKLLIENWYNDMMDRVSGWYKQQAYRILIYIGLVLAVAFNISTIEIVEKLSADKNAREALVLSATKYVNDHIDKEKVIATSSQVVDTAKKGIATHSSVSNSDSSKAVDSAKNEISKAKNETKPLINITTDSPKIADAGFAAIRSKIDSIKILYKSSIEDNSDIVGLGWGDYGYTADSLQWEKNIKAGIKGCEPKRKNIPGKILYILDETRKTPRKWLGFLITALAISLGAPFWFDLLNKFINLRVSGAKPTNDKGTSTPISKTALLNQKPDPTAKG